MENVQELARKLIDYCDKCNHQKFIETLDLVSPNAAITANGLMNYKQDLLSLDEDEVAELFESIDAELKLEEYHENRLFFAFAALGAMFELRSKVDKNPFCYPPGRASESDDIDHTLIMNDLEMWDDQYVQRFAEISFQTKDQFIIRAAAYLIGIRIWSKKEASTWETAWLSDLFIFWHSEYVPLAQHPGNSRILEPK
ncbi:hypothetical protein Pan54_31590 [Rubinisphaera italica]|uniref:Uncharacterized protein n=1 Tax=Rubinisphaera italica TaxID=2527969 RepID=A0A5C5XH56_9PLAN|nr:hypothetical protein Pan54_31590 [Rubinisphaera italica]